MCEELELEILQLSRNGNHKELHEFMKQHPDVNINCQGKHKSNKTWTPLHLAAYFGHLGAVEILLKNNADPNILNHTGDSPLHKAALTSREDVVMCLLQHKASTSIKNDEGKLASQVACSERIRDVLEEFSRSCCFYANLRNAASLAQKQFSSCHRYCVSHMVSYLHKETAEKGEALRDQEMFFQAVKEGRVDDVKKMLSSNLVSVNVSDSLGNTALHHSAMRDQRSITVALLQCGADPAKTNTNGQKASGLCESEQMRRLLEVRPVRASYKCAKRFEGPLMKGKRFLGPRWHWVVLERGVMSFFSRRADAGLGSKRKAFKYLTEATIKVCEDNQFGFTVHYFDGSKHNLMVNSKGDPLLHRKKWMNAITEHVDYSNHFVVDDHVVIENDDIDDDTMSIVDVTNSVQSAQAHHQVLESHIQELTSIVQQFVAFQSQSSTQDGQQLSTLVMGKCHKVLNSSTEMSQSFAECLAALERQNEARDSQLNEERERNRVLEQALQALATEHLNLERSITTHSSPVMPSQPHDMERKSSHRRTSSASKSASKSASNLADFLSDDDQFYDAISGDSASSVDEMSLVEARYDEPNDIIATSQSTSSQQRCFSELPLSEKDPSHRTRLPVPMFSREEFSIWHILRQCIGKELSKITMPVIFNEPLSFIERLCEYMEYSELLEQACKADDSIKRMEFVAAFAVSALASQLNRLGKPFNPLLGETFENLREDLGFHWVSEQVSHHPPVSAFHARSTTSRHPFVFHGSIYPKLKFWGKSVEVEPKGTLMLELTEHGETYTWTNPKISIHNIVVGKLWMEQHGVMEITNHKTSERCVVTFKPYSWFRNDVNKIEGTLTDTSQEEVRYLVGDWTRCVFSLSTQAHDELVRKSSQSDTSSSKRKNRSKSNSSTIDVIDILSSLEGDCQRLWEVQPRPEISAEMYNMTSFAMTLNEERLEGHDLPPTDSRLRPDIRALENGDIDGASDRKHYLEEKQRSARKLRHKKKTEWSPRWFAKNSHPLTGNSEWTFNQRYLDRDWSNSPDIF